MDVEPVDLDAQARHCRRRGEAKGEADGAASVGASVRHGLGIGILASPVVLEQNPARVPVGGSRRRTVGWLLFVVIR
jgi:hypothetical protein